MIKPTENPTPTDTCCAQCGGKKFVLKGIATDDAPVTCSTCGAILGPWKTIRGGMLDLIEKEPAKGGIARPAIASKATAI